VDERSSSVGFSQYTGEYLSIARSLLYAVGRAVGRAYSL